MTIWRRTLLKQAAAAMGVVFAATLATTAPSQAQPLELKIMAPAAPGGGWDQTSRSLQQALVTSGLVKSAQVTNVTGAGGTLSVGPASVGTPGTRVEVALP